MTLASHCRGIALISLLGLSLLLQGCNTLGGITAGSAGAGGGAGGGASGGASGGAASSGSGAGAAPVAEPVTGKLRIALALGGGAARGFAHIGVIKMLEAQGIVPDIVVGTSAGSLVGALYAGGYNGFELQRIALQLEDAVITDWSLPDRGFIKGEALQRFVNQNVQNRPLEKLNKPFAAVATDLQNGQAITFRTGNTGTAVRASSSVPGVFQPVSINGRDYVDGGLISPVPVRAARSMGATLVIAVYISSDPRQARTRDTIDILLQTFSIMGQGLAGNELAEADVVIRPEVGNLRSANFDDRHRAILEGEKAAQAAIALIRQKIADKSTASPVRQ